MLKLMKLEMKKVKMNIYIRNAAIANIIMLAILLIMITASLHGADVEFTSIPFTFGMVDSLVKAVFIIFAATLVAKFVIEEYKSNTITVLFMYPINRKKLIAAKLLIVALFTFTAIVLSNIFIDFVLCVVNNFYSFTPDKLTMAMVINNFIKIIGSGLTSAGMGLIPLWFGMRKKSVPATIVSAIIIVSIVCSNNGDFSLSSIIAIPITLALIGVFIAYMSIRNIEHVDISK